MKLDNCLRVGGFVRDTLLGLEANDIDYVVMGETFESMIAKGFQPVSEIPPVFLHPETKDEYALARSEISSGDGHNDFVYDCSSVTLVEDLLRRDLTINAMAMTDEGEIIDPYGGQADLKAGILRHVSNAFADDPLRVLRVARLAARYNFSVADETLELMTNMTSKGMLNSLTAERVWRETEKAFMTTTPSVYFKVLDQCGALAVVFPEIASLKGVPQRADYHAEGDVFVHTMMVVDEAADLCSGLSKASVTRIIAGALLHDLGKTMTPKNLLWDENGEILGRHHGHEDPERFMPLIKRFSERMKMPTAVTQFAAACAIGHQDAHRVKEMSGKGLVAMYGRLSLDRVLRHDKDFLNDFLVMCQADNQGRLITKPDGSLHRPTLYSQRDFVLGAMESIAAVKPGPIIQDTLSKGIGMDEAKNRVVGAQRKAAEVYIKSCSKESAPSL